MLFTSHHHKKPDEIWLQEVFAHLEMKVKWAPHRHVVRCCWFHVLSLYYFLYTDILYIFSSADPFAQQDWHLSFRASATNFARTKDAKNSVFPMDALAKDCDVYWWSWTAPRGGWILDHEIHGGCMDQNASNIDNYCTSRIQMKGGPSGGRWAGALQIKEFEIPTDVLCGGVGHVWN